MDKNLRVIVRMDDLMPNPQATVKISGSELVVQDIERTLKKHYEKQTIMEVKEEKKDP